MVRERQRLYNFTPVWNVETKQTNAQNRSRLIDTKDRLTVAPGGEGWGLRCRVQHGNTVHNVVITRNGARWALEMARGSLCKVCDCLTTARYIRH